MSITNEVNDQILKISSCAGFAVVRLEFFDITFPAQVELQILLTLLQLFEYKLWASSNYRRFA